MSIQNGDHLDEVDGHTPAASMLRMIYGSLLTQLLSVAAELGLSDLMTEQPRSVEDLAVHTGAEVDSLYRMLRGLAGAGVFVEVTPRSFAMTELSATLRSEVDGSLRDVARLVGSDATHRTLTELTYSVRTGQPAFDHVHGVDWWSHLADEPHLAGIFHGAMGSMARRSVSATIDRYDLSGVRRLVDVGGGHGLLAVTLLREYPEMSAVVYDLPTVLAGARAAFTDAGLAERAELVPGDFFDSVPTGGDAYVLSWVLHDWDDAACVEILSNVRSAMRSDGRVIVLDTVIPRGNSPHLGKLLDVVMLAQHTGRERTEEELIGLLGQAGLRHVETMTTEAWPSGMLIAEP